MKVFGAIFLAALIILAFMASAWLAAFALLAVGFIGMIGCALLALHKHRPTEEWTTRVAIKNGDEVVEWLHIPDSQMFKILTHAGRRYQVIKGEGPFDHPSIDISRPLPPEGILHTDVFKLIRTLGRKGIEQP